MIVQRSDLLHFSIFCTPVSVADENDTILSRFHKRNTETRFKLFAYCIKIATVQTSDKRKEQKVEQKSFYLDVLKRYWFAENVFEHGSTFQTPFQIYNLGCKTKHRK